MKYLKFFENRSQLTYDEIMDITQDLSDNGFEVWVDNADRRNSIYYKSGDTITHDKIFGVYILTQENANDESYEVHDYSRNLTFSWNQVLPDLKELISQLSNQCKVVSIISNIAYKNGKSKCGIETFISNLETLNWKSDLGDEINLDPNKRIIYNTQIIFKFI